MNYADLPVSERIKMASDYALLVIEDRTTNEDVIKDLQERFFLTHEDALKAFERTRTVHPSDFKQLQNNAILKALASVAFSIVCGFFYLFMGTEVGIVFVVLGVLFFIAAFGGFIMAVEKTLDRFFYQPAVKKGARKNVGREGKKEPDWSVQIFVVSFFVWIFLLFNYLKKDGYVNPDRLATLRVVLSKAVEQRSTEGKNPSYYYVYYFNGASHEFRFYETYYKYCEPAFWQRKPAPGDTIGIQIYESDYIEYVRTGNANKSIDIINILLNKHPLIDLGARNKDQLETNLHSFLIASGAVVVLLVLTIARRKMII